jgi:hypothetical protein
MLLERFLRPLRIDSERLLSTKRHRKSRAVPHKVACQGRQDVELLYTSFYLASYKDQLGVGREPLRLAEQGDRSYLGPPVG